MDSHIIFENVSYTYNPNTPFAMRALYNINLSIPKDKVTAIIGHTGSGKSTLLQHLNVLVRPTEGTIMIGKEKVSANSKNNNLKALRKKVGVVFQFPESQLFEETVLKDVMFGPLNFGVSREEAEQIAKEKLSLVGISEDLFERSPFELSGGQMRRVAIAGVLALNPEVLVLDEPTAGLDPMGHLKMMELFMEIHRKSKLSVVLVTHQMEDVVKYADYTVVLEAGKVANAGTVGEIFSDIDVLRAQQLEVPKSAIWMRQIREKMQLPISQKLPLTIESLVSELALMKGALSDDR